METLKQKIRQVRKIVFESGLLAKKRQRFGTFTSRESEHFHCGASALVRFSTADPSRRIGVSKEMDSVSDYFPINSMNLLFDE